MKALQLDYILFLEGRRLDAVTFLNNCLQLEFDYATITAYNWPVILGEALDYTNNNAEYQNRLCSLITKRVMNITNTTKGLVLTFDNTELLFPLDGIREILFIVNDNSEWYSYPIH
jgi:hypothetical protein